MAVLVALCTFMGGIFFNVELPLSIASTYGGFGIINLLDVFRCGE